MTVVKELDFEETQTYFVNIQASDKAAAPEQRRTALTVLTVHVTDSDDQVMMGDVRRQINRIVMMMMGDEEESESELTFDPCSLFAGARVGSPSVHQPGDQWPGGGGAGHLPGHAARHGQVTTTTTTMRHNNNKITGTA